MRKKLNGKNLQMVNTAEINSLTYFDYLNRFKKVALSIFEWVNLPKSMNAQYLEKCLYYYGQAGFLKDKNYGFINTKLSDNGKLNIYGFPISFHCYSFEYDTTRKLYTGIEGLSENQRKAKETSECILVQNNWDRLPTYRKYGIIRNAFI